MCVTFILKEREREREREVKETPIENEPISMKMNIMIIYMI